MNIRERLLAIGQIVDAGVDAQGAAYILDLMGASSFPPEILGEIRLYSEYLPKAQESAFTREQRYLHFLWDSLDKLPISVIVDFAIPFRRVIAKRLFKRCGKDFIAEENVRFNFGQNLEIGDDVFMNRGVYLDAKGGIVLEDFVGLGERVEVYTHTHSESEHGRRSYGRVVIKSFAKIYAQAMILPGVTVGEQAIVAAKSLVNKDVEPNMVVAGIPAGVIRERNTNGRMKGELNHIWLHDSAFQDE
jgi:acetyltransferase-like isoleucine patch superfamily enzyme